MEIRKIYLGTITGVRGFKGEMKVTHLDIDNVNLPSGTKVYIGYSPNFSNKYQIKKWRQTRKQAKVELTGIDSESKAAEFIEAGIFIEETVLNSLSPEATVLSDYIGMKILDAETGKLLGKVADYWELTANDVFVVEGEKSFNVPNIPEFVTKINKKEKEIYIKVIPGLID